MLFGGDVATFLGVHFHWELDLRTHSLASLLFLSLFCICGWCLSLVSHTGCSLSTYEISKPAHKLTHFFQQGHTYSNIVIPPNIATSCRPGIQTHKSMGGISIQTTTVCDMISKLLVPTTILGLPLCFDGLLYLRKQAKIYSFFLKFLLVIMFRTISE